MLSWCVRGQRGGGIVPKTTGLSYIGDKRISVIAGELRAAVQGERVLRNQARQAWPGRFALCGFSVRTVMAEGGELRAVLLGVAKPRSTPTTSCGGGGCDPRAGPGEGVRIAGRPSKNVIGKLLPQVPALSATASRPDSSSTGGSNSATYDTFVAGVGTIRRWVGTLGNQRCTLDSLGGVIYSADTKMKGAPREESKKEDRRWLFADDQSGGPARPN